MSRRADVPGTVYLLHFAEPYKHAKHYLGWAAPGNLDARLEAHRVGRGARLMEVIKEAGGTFYLARTWSGDRGRERELKDRHEGPRLCPECSPRPRPAQPRPTQPRTATRPAPGRPPVPKPERPHAYERGAASARRAIQQQINAGFSADRIAEVQGRIFAALQPERLTAESAEEARGYREAAEAMITAHRQATAPQPSPTAEQAAQHQEEGTRMTTSTTAQTAPETRPATEWMKGAQTAHDLVIRQAEAGHSADHIAGKWEEALATYDDAKASPAEREWHAGAKETAADMVQTLREMERAEEEQAQAARDGAEAEPEAEAGQ